MEICLEAVAFENPKTSKQKITNLQFILDTGKLFGIFKNYSKYALKLQKIPARSMFYRFEVVAPGLLRDGLALKITPQIRKHLQGEIRR